MVVVAFSTPPQIPGLPFQHPQREPLRQIGEDYGLSQGPHWERSEGLSSAGWMESTHLLCRITAGRAQSEPERLRPLHLSSSLESACRGSINSHIFFPLQKRTERRDMEHGSAGPLRGRLIPPAAESFGNAGLNRDLGVTKTEASKKIQMLKANFCLRLDFVQIQSTSQFGRGLVFSSLL